MTRLLQLLCLMALIIGCKTEPQNPTKSDDSQTETRPKLTVAEKIALAHGFQHWKTVDNLQFTFNVDRGDNHFERTWQWQPKQNYVVAAINKDSIYSYTRTDMDSTSVKVDKGFINDKYWLLVPFQLVWDQGTTISEPVKTTAPIANTEMNKLTIVYSNEGGYTPGDAYDIYFDNDYIIREWVYRKGNATEPSMITTFEDYQDFNGLKIATSHKMAEGNFNLYFSNIEVK